MVKGAKAKRPQQRGVNQGLGVQVIQDSLFSRGKAFPLHHNDHENEVYNKILDPYDFSTFYAEDGGNSFLLNIGSYVPNYTSSQHRNL